MLVEYRRKYYKIWKNKNASQTYSLLKVVVCYSFIWRIWFFGQV